MAVDATIAQLERELTEDMADPQGEARVTNRLVAEGKVREDGALEVAYLESKIVEERIIRLASRGVFLGMAMVGLARIMSKPPGGQRGVRGLGSPPDVHLQKAEDEIRWADTMLQGIEWDEEAPTCKQMFDSLRSAMSSWAQAESHITSVPMKIVPEDLVVKARDVSRRIGAAQSVFERKCVRRGQLEGATKVCIRYFRGPSGKVRCAQWSSGAGYTPWPHSESNYYIQEVRDYFAKRLCEDPRNRRRCGLSRKYRYRRSLPYPPAEVVKDAPKVPKISRSGVVKIIALGPAQKPRAKRGG